MPADAVRQLQVSAIRALLIALAAVLVGPLPASAAPAGFSNWAAVIVSGDDRAAHVDEPTETFDNARRDLGRALERRGFAVGHIEEFSVEPQRHPDTHPDPARLANIAAGLKSLADRAQEGCLVYLTSHGSPDGAVLGDMLLPPRTLAHLVTSACGARPTILVVSACYSGVFIRDLAGPHRLVLTAARSDRSSFGCGESDRYPYFDGCLLDSLPASVDFIDLAGRARRCVAKREKSEHMSPPSDPQISVGARFKSPAFAPMA